MFWFVRFTLRSVFRLKLVVISALAGMGIAYGLQLRQQYRSWGRDAADPERPLVGDEYVADPDLVETRSLVVHARPEAVWPWLVQLGYGRGGWYGFEQLERPWSPGGGPVGKSADRILEEYQDLAVGDLVPMNRQGGFEARVVEENEALVLYLDEVMAREQVQEGVADADEAAAAEVSGMEVPPFTVSWAFILEPLSRDRTRLVERLRFRVEGANEQQRMALPVLKAGVFALMRSQMMGIQERVEAAADVEELVPA